MDCKELKQYVQKHSVSQATNPIRYTNESAMTKGECGEATACRSYVHREHQLQGIFLDLASIKLTIDIVQELNHRSESIHQSLINHPITARLALAPMETPVLSDCSTFLYISANSVLK